MKLEEAIGRLKRMITVSSIMKLENLINSDADMEYIKNADAIEIVLQEIERLQKENEQYISGELMTRNQAKHFEEINKKYYIHKDKIREKIEKLNADNEQDTEIVKRYEEMRRNSQDSFYRNSYQKSIHELNTKRSMRKIFISILENLLKEE